MIIDTHAHYDDRQFDIDRNELLSRTLLERGVGYCVNVCADIRSLDETLKLVEGYERVFGAVGIHPDEVGAMSSGTIEKMIEMAKHPKIVAIGEIGLDYYREDGTPKEIQKDWFIRELGVARETGLPVIIHSREAAQDTMELMKKYHAEEIGGVIHCYSYKAQMALEYVEMGFYIGVGGVVTFNNAAKLREVVEAVPMERIVLETDCPYLAPVPFRGKRNDSTNLKYVAAKIGELKGYTIEEVEAITSENAKKLYPKLGAMIG